MTPVVVGREPELAALGGFLAPGHAAWTMVVEGEPGIGKTTLWETALDLAASDGFCVLAARASEAEATLSFAALADLLDGVDPDCFASLPGPQLHALEVALRRADPAGAAPDPFAIASGFLGVVRQLAGRGPLLIAVDDIHWLDQSSSGPLSFVARRLPGPHTRLLLSKRPGPPLAIEQETKASELTSLALRPLSFGAVNRLLTARLGPVLPRRLISQVHHIADGNPLFALELGRRLVEGAPTGGATYLDVELTLPGMVEDALAERVRTLSEPVGRALLAVALSGRLSRAELTDLVGEAAVEEAISAQLITLDRTGARPSHPLFAVAARQRASRATRQALHRQLAGALPDPTLRARHLALATDEPDSSLAGDVSAAARAAVEVGAVHEGEQLAANALRLTPRDDPEWPERLLDLARYHLLAGAEGETIRLLERHYPDLPPGRTRARAQLLWAEPIELSEEEGHLQAALNEAPDDPEIQALVLARRGMLAMVNRVEDVRRGTAYADEAWRLERARPGEGDARVASAYAWAQIMRGRPIDDLVRDWAGSVGSPQYDQVIERPLAIRHAFRGEIGLARQIIERLHQQAVDRGDYRSMVVFDTQRAEFALRVGDVAEAAAIIEETDRVPEMDVTRIRLVALLAAVAGDADRAVQRAAEVVEIAERAPCPGWDRLEAIRALGLAALFGHDLPSAVQHLSTVWDHTCSEGIDDPGAFPAAGDLVEALVLSGADEEAAAVIERLGRLAAAQDHPWARETTKRGQALRALAHGYSAAPAGELLDVATAYGKLGLRFDQARTLLYLGRVERRARKRKQARERLEQAASIFEGLGASGWAEAARHDLDRVSGRRPAARQLLTASERRVVELAIKGLSNKEIAGQLYVGVYTVEAHLSHAYTKLGVRSRTQLAQALMDREDA